MNKWHYWCFCLGVLSGWAVPYAVHEFYKWITDEVIAWRLRRNYRKLYWFLNDPPWRK